MKVFERGNDIKEKVLEGLDLSYKRLIKNKKERNFDLIISRDGKIVRIKPEEMPCEELH